MIGIWGLFTSPRALTFFVPLNWVEKSLRKLETAFGNRQREIPRKIVPGAICFMIDLHVHTSMSDGTFSPAAVVELADQKGLSAIAITDHDTVAGVAPACWEGRKRGVEIVPGVEISSEWPSGIMHILGYFVDPDHEGLSDELSELRSGRMERIPKIVERLRGCGVFISVDEVKNEALGGAPGRPHIAQIMRRRGYVATIQEAFDRFLRRGRPAYIEKKKIAPSRALKIIHQAGGLAVLAHPYSLNESDPDRFEEIVSELISFGLDGLEAYCPRHTPDQVALYVSLGRKLNLSITAGTDFHGATKPDIALGAIPPYSPIPYEILARLKERHASVMGGRGAYEAPSEQDVEVNVQSRD